MNNLPEKITAGDTLEVQICPPGTFKSSCGDVTINQICDEQSFNNMLTAFNESGKKEILVDFEHWAESDDGSTEAAAWIQSLSIDPERGLLGVFKFTDSGADAVSNRRLRFLSPVWTLNADGRPKKLISVGLTNKPNLPVAPVLNREQQQPTKENNKMDKIALALNLPPDATEEQILEALAALGTRVSGLQAQVDSATTAANTAEAEKIADDNADRIENREKFVELYVKNKDVALQLLNTLKPVEAKKVCNKSAALTPQIKTETDEQTIVNKYKAMPPGKEKDDYLAKNKKVLAQNMR